MQTINRRTALSGIAAVSATVAPTGAFAASGSTTPDNPVVALVEAYRRASERLNELSAPFEDLEANISPARVSVGREIWGVDSVTHEEITKPIWAYNESQIRKNCDDHRQNLLRWNGTNDRIIARINEREDARLAMLLARFKQEKAVQIAAEDAAGITAARAAIDKADDEVEACMRAILEHRYTTIEEVRTAAEFLDHEVATNGPLIDFVTTLARSPESA